ncbi:hypothetical protein [Hymenobacter pini]|uniref:hypothetical protein n=1 Tax=Hymenobacter pini TaxID=2880879 RepID=UPI001CF14918|nr:hypothetical protein [Hymenobacter pini]MCA8829527.1 hypothetical protein [Hymenobacter pini]
MQTTSPPACIDLRTFDGGRLTMVLLCSFLGPLLLGLPFLFLPDFHLAYHTGLVAVGSTLALLVLAVGLGVWWSIRRVRLSLLGDELRLDWLDRRGTPTQTFTAERASIRHAAIEQGEKPEQYYLKLEVAEAKPIVLTLVSTARHRTEPETLLRNWMLGS